MNQTIAKDFNLLSLLRFAFPTTIMMIFVSLYTIVDGIFVSRYVGTDGLSAVNITYPFTSVIIAIAIMFATGGNAIIAREIGEKRLAQANKSFTLITLSAVIIGTITSVLAIWFIDPLVRILGANDAIAPMCRSYLRILLLFAPFAILQMLFQSFFVTAGKPHMGLFVTVLAGISNMILDYVFIGVMDMGIKGAAYATATGYCIPAIWGIFYFIFNKKGLHFVQPKFHGNTILKSCLNGSSEMVTNLSTSIITFLFNIIMMNYLGTDGVAAITVVLYCQFLMTSLFMGFSIGVAPIISYNYGSQNTERQKGLFKICIWFILLSSITIFVLALGFTPYIAGIFSKKGTNVYNLTVRGFYLFSSCFIFAGINIFTSALFTSLSNGRISAIISFSRTFLFIIAGILLLPFIFGIDGIWLAIPFAELCTAIISIIYIKNQHQRYALY